MSLVGKIMRSGASLRLAVVGTAALFGVAAEPVRAQIFTVTPDLYSVFTPSQTPAETHGEEGPVDAVQRMVQQFEPAGLWVGGQHIVPSATISTVYDDNVFATQTAPKGDVVSHFLPAIDVANGEQVVSYKFDLSGDFAEYAGHPSLDNFGTAVALGVVADLAPTLRLESRTRFQNRHADPADFILPVANAPLSHLPAIQSFEQDISFSRDVGPWGLWLTGSYANSREDDLSLSGFTLPLSSLNSNIFSVTPKISYELAPDIRQFMQVEYQRENLAEGDLNSGSYALVTGIDFELRRLVAGTVNVGYREHVYNRSGFGSVGGVTYNLNLAWYPTELLTLKLIGSQDYIDSIITQNFAAPSGSFGGYGVKFNGMPVLADKKTIEAQADYSVTADIALSGVGGLTVYSYPGTNREDDFLETGISLIYLISPNMVASAQYRYSMRTSTASNFNFNRDQVGIALKLQY